MSAFVDQVTATLEKLDSAPPKNEQDAAEIERQRQDLKNKAIELGRGAEDSGRVQASVARAVAAAHDLPQASQYAERAVTLAPDDPVPLVTRGLIRYKLGDFKGAEADAKLALRHDPKNASAYSLYRLSSGRAASGAETDGRPVAAAPAPPASPPAAAPAGPPQQASLPELPMLAEHEKRARDLLAASMSALRLKDARKALELGLQASKHDPKLPDARMAMALARRELGQSQAALSDAEAAVALWAQKQPREDAAHAAALCLRADLKLKGGDAAGAEADAIAALNIDPGSAAARLYKARAAEKLGRDREHILADYARAAELEPAFGAEYEEAAKRLLPGSMAATLPNKAAQDHDAMPPLLWLLAGACILMVAALGARKWIRSLTRS